MKRHLQYSLSLVIFIFCFSSCQDCYYIENDLHGMWQVTSVEKLPEGDIVEAQGQLYYMFQRSMVQLGYKPLNSPQSMRRYIAHFDLIGEDSIGMGYFRMRTTGEGDFVNQEIKIPLDSLRKFGLYDDHTTFSKFQSNQKLILTSDSACIVLRRY